MGCRVVLLALVALATAGAAAGAAQGHARGSVLSKRAVAAVGDSPRRPARRCHPSYKGACLDPNAADYDCRGGSGNGPKYTGPVRVVGPDVFGLDRDGDGYGCQNS
jgi:hypothetical protein